MDPLRIPLDIGRRFHRPPVPSVVACVDLSDPIVFSHVQSGTAMPAPTLTPPVENAFSIHVHHAPISRGDIWIQGQHTRLAPIDVGGVFIFDLRTKPVAHLHEGFEFSRFQLSRKTIEDLACERGLRRLTELKTGASDPDPVIEHLALALLHHTAIFNNKPDPLFSDSVALALFAHVTKKYGGALEPSAGVGTLAPWQIRRLDEWVETHMDESISIGALAKLAGLSSSYFARAFAQSTGVPPHQWVLKKRIERAKQLMARTRTSLGEVAAMCGFADQSHLTRVFLRLSGVTPSQWRRRLC